MTTLTIRIPDSLRKDLKSLSREGNRAVSDIVRESLRRHVALERFRALRGKVLPFAESQGILTDEDVFRALK
jgi:predicted transcriptional regulator